MSRSLRMQDKEFLFIQGAQCIHSHDGILFFPGPFFYPGRLAGQVKRNATRLRLFLFKEAILVFIGTGRSRWKCHLSEKCAFFISKKSKTGANPI